MGIETGKMAKIIVQNCFRNTYLENLHTGIFPASKTGDYSDVKVVTPYGEIPWAEVGRISDKEMKILMKEAVNKTFTLLEYLDNETESFPQVFRFPKKWDKAEIDKDFKTSLATVKRMNRPTYPGR